MPARDGEFEDASRVGVEEVWLMLGGRERECGWAFVSSIVLQSYFLGTIKLVQRTRLELLEVLKYHLPGAGLLLTVRAGYQFCMKVRTDRILVAIGLPELKGKPAIALVKARWVGCPTSAVHYPVIKLDIPDSQYVCCRHLQRLMSSKWMQQASRKENHAVFCGFTDHFSGLF